MKRTVLILAILVVSIEKTVFSFLKLLHTKTPLILGVYGFVIISYYKKWDRSA